MNELPGWKRVNPKNNAFKKQADSLIHLMSEAVDQKRKEIEVMKRGQNGDT